MFLFIANLNLNAFEDVNDIPNMITKIFVIFCGLFPIQSTALLEKYV